MDRPSREKYGQPIVIGTRSDLFPISKLNKTNFSAFSGSATMYRPSEDQWGET
jgi:hypothetical protein